MTAEKDLTAVKDLTARQLAARQNLTTAQDPTADRNWHWWNSGRLQDVRIRSGFMRPPASDARFSETCSTEAAGAEGCAFMRRASVSSIL